MLQIILTILTYPPCITSLDLCVGVCVYPKMGNRTRSTEDRSVLQRKHQEAGNCQTNSDVSYNS